MSSTPQAAPQKRRTSEQWIAQYARSHQHPVNRFCHTFGIPFIVIAIVWGVTAVVLRADWRYPLGLFAVGWALQFIGHAFERSLPEFFHDWRFLFVGLRWWAAKMRGRA